MRGALSIRTKLVAIIVGGVLVPLVAALIVAAAQDIRQLDREARSRHTMIAVLASQYSAADLAFDNPAEGAQTLSQMESVEDVVFVALYDLNGELFCSYVRETGGPGRERVPSRLSSLPDPSANRAGLHLDVFQPVTHAGTRFGTLLLRTSYRRVEERLHEYLLRVCLIAVGIGLFALAFAFALQQVISRPILALAAVARRITDQADYSLRVERVSDDELGALSDDFNAMVAQSGRRQEELRASEHKLMQSYDALARAQRDLVQNERLAAVGELSAVMAHEVRNPICVIFNSLDLLSKMGDLSPDGKQLLGIVHEETDRLNRIVDELLDFSRPTPPNYSYKEISSIIVSAIELAKVAGGNKHTIRCEIDPRVSHLCLDERMIRQALINLMLNAVQAMPTGGAIFVRASEEVSEGTTFVRVDIRDTGPGIPADVIDRLFQPFFTTKATGTGLGLAVVRRFVEAHQGRVEVKSTMGEGTTFTVLLPTNAENEARRLSSATEASGEV